jgi:methylmalonyl-CoA mutase C-terminal domain/subunit
MRQSVTHRSAPGADLYRLAPENSRQELDRGGLICRSFAARPGPPCPFLRLPFARSFQYPCIYMPEKKIRVLIAKPGLDGHDRGAKIIARALRDAGMEVIYTGLRQTPEMIASAALQEDVDVIGLSILSGAHNTLCPRLMELLRQNGMSDVTVLIGGIIPEADVAGLKKAGIAEVFLPGTTTQAIVEFIRQRVAAASASQGAERS